LFVPVRFFAALLFTVLATAQQVPFVPIAGPNAPASSVLFLEDSRGGFWLGGAAIGAEPLTYFDGSRFVPISNAPKSIIGGMAQDSEGGIWIANRLGLYRFYKGRFNKYASGISTSITGLDSDTFLAEIERPGMSDSADLDLVRLSKAADGWRAETIGKATPGAGFQADGEGRILYPCSDGVCEISSEDVRTWRKGSALPVKRHHLPVHTTDGIVVRDRFGCLWMRSQVDAMYQCPGDFKATVLPTSVVSLGPLTILQLDDGTIVIPSFAEMVIGRPGRFRVITPANGYPGGVNAILSRDGSLWFSSGKGIYVFSGRDKAEFWTEREGLQGPTWSISRLGDRILAIAGNEIRFLSEDRSHWQVLSEFANALSLLPGADGTMFASSLRNGVEQISASGTILHKSAITPAAKLVRTPDGQLWATGSTLARVVVDGRQVSLQPAKMPWPQRYTEDAKVDRSGGLWACSDSGLIHLDKAGWHLITTADGLLGSRCLSFAVDRDEDVWYSYSRVPSFSLIQNPAEAKPLIRHFSNGGEVGTAQAFFFESDKRGWLWRGSGDGIYVAEPEQARQGQWLHIDTKDGLPSNDSNQFAFFQDKDGSVWFGAGTTITHWSPPADLTRPSYAPLVFVSGFSLNKGGFQIANQVDNMQYGADVVAHLGSLQFDRRSALRFRYRLLPEQTQWAAERNLDISLGKLSWGKHTLEIQARLYTGPWSETSSKSFSVLKPIWLSWPALLVLCAGGGAAAVGELGRRKRLRERTGKTLPGLAGWRVAALSPNVSFATGTKMDGRFRVGKMLARGGFGTVFEGLDTQRGVACAIKIFRHELMEQSWMSARFQQEVSALQKVRNPHVVGIYGHGTTPSGSFYLVMELIDGETLRNVLNKGPLKRTEVGSYLRQIGVALREIHAQGIRHRDLKPENLMIRYNAQPGKELVLIDFSIAIVQDPDETIHGVSRAAGTIQYMAPEQGIGYADSSSDVYSLAKVLVEMLTGKRLSLLLPNATLDLPKRIRDFLNEMRFGLSEASIDMIAQALEFDPARRIKDAYEFADGIAKELASHVES
jgi:ligand-binding sensor domain-containing protein/predicted Ser/Thr protein kinase